MISSSYFHLNHVHFKLLLPYPGWHCWSDWSWQVVNITGIVSDHRTGVWNHRDWWSWHKSFWFALLAQEADSHCTGMLECEVTSCFLTSCCELGPIVWTPLKSPLSWVHSTSWVYSNPHSNKFLCMKQSPCQLEFTHLTEDLSDLIQKRRSDWSAMTHYPSINTAQTADDSCIGRAPMHTWNLFNNLRHYICHFRYIQRVV